MPLKDLLPSEQAKRGDGVLKVATELLEQCKRFTDRDSYIMARGLLTSASDYRCGLEKKSPIRRSQQSRLYLDKAQETLKTIEVIGENVSNAPDEGEYGVTSILEEHERESSETIRNTDSGADTAPPSMVATL